MLPLIIALLSCEEVERLPHEVDASFGVGRVSCGRPTTSGLRQAAARIALTLKAALVVAIAGYLAILPERP